MIVEEFNNKLGLSLSLIINIIDPDAIVFGGGVSNEIKSLDEIKEVLSSMSLSMGMDLPGWPPENIEELSKKYEDPFKV